MPHAGPAIERIEEPAEAIRYGLAVVVRLAAVVEFHWLPSGGHFGFRKQCPTA
jgi:hypothetical protein